MLNHNTQLIMMIEPTFSRLSLTGPLSAFYASLSARFREEGGNPETYFSRFDDPEVLMQPERWYEVLALCEWAVDAGCSTAAVQDFFEWIFKGFDCHAVFDLDEADYAWYWQKIHTLFDKLALRSPDALIEKGLQYFAPRRGYVDKAQTLAYLQQAIDRGSETARTILGYYLYFGLCGPADKEKGNALMDSAISERGKARVAVYRSYIALNENRPEDVETLLAPYAAGHTDPFIRRLVAEVKAFYDELSGRPEEAAAGYREVIGLIPSGFAMMRLGYLLYSKKVADADLETGLKWLEKAFRFGRPDVTPSLFSLYFESGEPWQDETKACYWLRKGAEYNEGYAFYQLGYLSLSNEAYKDQAKGLAYLDAAIGLDYVDAYLLKAYLYREGEGVEKDISASLDLLQNAEKLGSAHAAYRIGCLYDAGEMNTDGTPDYPQALAWFEKAAEGGDLYAIEYAGRYRLTGTGCEIDTDKAKEWYEKGAAAGSSYCMVELALMYEEGNGVPENLSETFRWIRQAAETGYAHANYLLGRCYKYAIGTDENPDEAVAAFTRAADQDHAKALAELGLSYEAGYGVEPDAAKALAYMQQSAEQGLAYAAYKLGCYYAYGLDTVAVDYDRALEWFEKAAEAEYPEAMLELGDYYLYDYAEKGEQAKAYAYYEQAAREGCVNEGLGICLEYGYGVETNEGEAFKYYLKGAEDGYIRAMYHVACCYYFGTGVKENFSEAYRWFSDAAIQQHLGAAYYKGKMLLAGEGCATDLEEGISWLRKAAEADLKDAQFELGNCYLVGKGVEENEDTAMEWFEKAADNGHEQALKITGRRRRR